MECKPATEDTRPRRSSESSSASSADSKSITGPADAAAAAAAASTVATTVPSAQREAMVEPSMSRGGHEMEMKRGARAALAAPLSKPIVPAGRRVRGQQPFKWVSS